VVNFYICSVAYYVVKADTRDVYTMFVSCFEFKPYLPITERKLFFRSEFVKLSI
jgi:hypothetical protein